MTQIDNSALLNELHLAASQVSRFNAADWEQIGREREAAGKAWARWVDLKQMAQQRGIYNPEEFKRYLV